MCLGLMTVLFPPSPPPCFKGTCLRVCDSFAGGSLADALLHDATPRGPGVGDVLRVRRPIVGRVPRPVGLPACRRRCWDTGRRRAVGKAAPTDHWAAGVLLGTEDLLPSSPLQPLIFSPVGFTRILVIRVNLLSLPSFMFNFPSTFVWCLCILPRAVLTSFVHPPCISRTCLRLSFAVQHPSNFPSRSPSYPSAHSFFLILHCAALCCESAVRYRFYIAMPPLIPILNGTLWSIDHGPFVLS